MVLLLSLLLTFGEVSINDQDANEYMIKVLERYNSSIYNTPFMMEAYYYEYATSNEKVLQYTEAQGVILSRGYDSEIVLQPISFIAIGLRKTSRDSLWTALAKRQSQKYNEFIYDELALNDLIMMSTFRTFEHWYLLNKDNFRQYFECTFYPQSEKDEFIVTAIQKGDRKYPINAKFYINAKNNNIERIEIKNSLYYAWTIEGYTIAELNVSFQDIGKKRFISNLDVTLRTKAYNFYMHFKTTKKAQDIKIRQYPLDQVTTLSYHRIVHYEPNEWRYNYSPELNQIFKADYDHEKIETQFKETHGQPHVRLTRKDGSLVDNVSYFKPGSVQYKYYQKIKAFYEQ